MEPKVKIFSHVMTEFGATPKFTDTEIVAVADENGVYTVPNLQGDVRIDVTLVPVDGVVLSGSDIATIDPEDAADITTMGVTGEATEERIVPLSVKTSRRLRLSTFRVLKTPKSLPTLSRTWKASAAW